MHTPSNHSEEKTSHGQSMSRTQRAEFFKKFARSLSNPWNHKSPFDKRTAPSLSMTLPPPLSHSHPLSSHPDPRDLIRQVSRMLPQEELRTSIGKEKTTSKNNSEDNEPATSDESNEATSLTPLSLSSSLSLQDNNHIHTNTELPPDPCIQQRKNSLKDSPSPSTLLLHFEGAGATLKPQRAVLPTESDLNLHPDLMFSSWYKDESHPKEIRDVMDDLVFDVELEMDRLSYHPESLSSLFSPPSPPTPSSSSQQDDVHIHTNTELPPDPCIQQRKNSLKDSPSPSTLLLHFEGAGATLKTQRVVLPTELQSTQAFPPPPPLLLFTKITKIIAFNKLHRSRRSSSRDGSTQWCRYQTYSSNREQRSW